MKISLHWLRDFIELPKNLDPQDLAELLTMHVVEVEGFEREADAFEKMVVGKVVSIEKHPNADRLSVCTVDAGSAGKKLNIVCGGKNLREGMLTAIALPGSRVKWHGEGDLVELKEAEVRGVKSFGMICAGGEIGLEDLQSLQPVVGTWPHILDLDYAVGAYCHAQSSRKVALRPGLPLAQALGKDDVVFEISNVSLSNRPDLWSHYGIAREIAVMYGIKLRQQLRYQLPVTSYQLQTNSKVTVKVADATLCPRYIGALVENAQLKETPEWLKKRLMAVGQRPVSPLVDISNYVMFEIGQPVHIFDASKIVESRGTPHQSPDKSGHGTGQASRGITRTIVVRKALRGEKIITLDGIERKLDEGMLVIADHEKPVAIAGVMGGLDSAVEEGTSSIVIEAATFDPVSIRNTSARLGLKTDASQRFEKSLDPHLPSIAAARVWRLLQECADKELAPTVRSMMDVSAPRKAPKPIHLSPGMLDRRIGMFVPRGKVKKILAGLGFTIRGTVNAWNITPPSWRATRDISIPEDIVEEVGRHLDYNTIPDALPSFPIAPPPVSAHHRLERSLKRFLAGAGFYEVEHKPFLDPSRWDPFGLETGNHIEVVNPIDPDARYLRQSLLPGLFNDIRANRNEAVALKFFAWGRIFIPQNGVYAAKKNAKERLPHQPVTLSLVLSEDGSAEETLRRMKGVALEALQAAGFQGEVEASPEAHAACRKETAFSLIAHGVQIGGGSVVSEALKAALGVAGKQNVGTFSIDIDTLAEVASSVKKYVPLPGFPAIQRDVAIIVDNAVTYAGIEKTVLGSAGRLLESLELFDVFRGEGIPQGKKSVALHLTFRAHDRTLQGREADEAMKGIVKQLTVQHEAEARE